MHRQQQPRQQILAQQIELTDSNSQYQLINTTEAQQDLHQDKLEMMDVQQAPTNKQNEQEYKQQDMLQQIPEQVIMQKLSQYFLSPTAKTIPYKYYFTKHSRSLIYSLLYLYHFIRADYHQQQVSEIFFTFLPFNNSPPKQLLKLIFEPSPGYATDRKTLINRYMSIPGCIAQHLASRKADIKAIETKVITQIYQHMSTYDTLSSQEQIFIVNKITTLNQIQTIIKYALQMYCKANDRLKLIKRVYQYLVRKDKILLSFFKLVIIYGNKANVNQTYRERVSLLKQQLSQMVALHHSTKQNYQSIVKLINNQYLQPSHAQILYQIILHPNKQLRSHIFQNLLVWWVQGNDHYLIYNMVKFKTNLMAIILTDFTKDEAILYSGQIGLGIQRRLMVATRVQVPNLVWAVLAQKLNFQIPKQFTRQLFKSDVDASQNQNEIGGSQQKQNKLNGSAYQKQHQQTNTSLYQQKTSKQEQEKQQNNEFEIKLKPPKNLYDCVLGLQNPLRKKITLELLPKIIRKNPDDLIFVWRDLISQLFYNLNQQTKQSVVSLFIVRPQSFIQSVGEIFFRKQNSLNDKIVLIEVMSEGVQQLSSKPMSAQMEKPQQQYYFKKVTSKYYNENSKNDKNHKQQTQDEGRTRRWGHTKIAHERKLKQKQSGGICLKIVSNQPYINRLYEIANQLFFRIISKLTLLSIFPSQPMFTTPMLKLLATLSFNLQNHIQKYKILTEITDICLLVIEHMQQKGKKQSLKKQDRSKYIRKWKDTNFAVLNTLNKISLVIDKFIPGRMLENLQQCVKRLKNSQQYGINPVINMIQANIYTNVSGQKVLA